MKPTFNTSTLRFLALTAIASLCTTACGGSTGSNAAGHSYAGADGVVQLQFNPDGKAVLAVGAVSTACTYSEAVRTLTLNCDGETTEFTIGDDGALVGPPAGMFARLAQQK